MLEICCHWENPNGKDARNLKTDLLARYSIFRKKMEGHSSWVYPKFDE